MIELKRYLQYLAANTYKYTTIYGDSEALFDYIKDPKSCSSTKNIDLESLIIVPNMI